MCRDQTGSTDKSTWGEVDFEPLIDGIHKTIAIHPHHQQRCENFVQMAALVSKTLVGEARRTWRATAISTLMRRFNIYAIEYKRGMVKDPKKRAKITRVTGNLRVCLFSTYVDNFIREVKEARRALGEEKCASLADGIAGTKNKRSEEERRVFLDGFEESVRECVHKHYKAEFARGYDETAVMGGKVFLRILTKKNGLEPQIDAEMIARMIPTKMNDFVNEFGAGNERLEEVPIKDKKRLLRRHEAWIAIEKNVKLSLEEAVNKTNAIVPISNEMKQILRRQQEIMSQ